MKKITLVQLIMLITSCSSNPDGKDENGHYVYKEKCLDGYYYNSLMMINDIPIITIEYQCTSSIIVKQYITE